MSLIRFIQEWRQWMARIKRGAPTKQSFREIKLELVPRLEEYALFQARKDEVQSLLTRMVLSLHRRGRPRKEEKEESRAA